VFSFKEGKIMLKFIVSSLLAVAASVSIAAVEVAGIKFEDTVSANGQELTLNGAGVRSRFMVKVYAAGLYVSQKSSNGKAIVEAKTARRVQMVMLRDLSADQLADALKDGIDNNASQAELDAIKAEIESLLNIMRGMKEAKKTQVIALDFSADGKTTVSVNGTARGNVASEPLQRALLKIWLGDKPIQNDLKSAMLGQS
jgi:Chalcone isomerase-like